MSRRSVAPVAVGGRRVGPGEPVYVIAEIGINHNGRLDLALRLVDAAHAAGCDAVKFQKRSPAAWPASPEDEALRDTPWGTLSYRAYRERLEFGADDFDAIDRHCRSKPIDWFASCWDEPSLEFVERFAPVAHKIASASLTDHALVRRIAAAGRPVFMSTGMSTMDEIRQAVALVDPARLLLAHTTSTYPCPPEEQNLEMIRSLAAEFPCPIGYSGHESGVAATLAAVALGACFVERHVTLDRSSWGTDQAASLEPDELTRLVRDVRIVSAAIGDGVKRVQPGEQAALRRLRLARRPTGAR